MIDSNAGLSEAKRALLQQRIRARGAVRDTQTQLVARAQAGPAPLAAVQEHLWHSSRLAPENPVYNEVIVIHKDGPFDAGALRAAFTELIRRHHIWRSSYSVVDGEPMQITHPAAPVELPVLDLSWTGRGEAELEAGRLAAEQARRPFDMANGPLLRPLLVRIAADHHRLYLALHHMIFDGFSVYRVVLPELVALYDDAVAGRRPSLPEPAIQYEDYAAWSRRASQGDDLKRRLEYWHRRLDGAPALELPLDRPRPSRRAFRGAMERLRIPSSVADGLRAVSRDTGGTLFQTMAAALAVLLQRYSGQDDVVFGTTVDQRVRPELEAMVGYCLTPLVLRADLGDDPPFTELLRNTRRDLLDGIDNTVPFDALVRELRPPRHPGANPIFQVTLMLEPPMAFTDPSWGLDLIDASLGNAVGHAKFDLMIELDERPDGGIHGRLIYDRDLFDDATAKGMVEHWDALLRGIVADPTRPISELPMLTEAERHQQLVEWNRTDTEYPRDACVHELVADQVHRTPAAIAVTDGRTELSYVQLNEHAGRLATHLRENGVGPDVRVGVCLDRSLDLVVALLAVLKAGGAFVPLEPDQPQARLAHMVNDAGPRVVLTTTRLEASLPPTAALLVRLDAERESWMAHPASSTGDCTPSNLAYVLFTSGSTGTPKGVMIEHRSLVNQLVWRTDSFKLGPGDRVLQKTPFGFDVSLWELFCPLIAGATMVLLEPGAQGDPVHLAAAIRSQRITALHFVPSMLQAFLAADVRGCDSVRLVASSGEALSAGLAQRFFECFGPEVELRNLYGPTEAAVDVTSWRCDPGGEAVVPIGRPVANTQIYLLGADDRPVPVGVAGELCIGGVQVARGYLNRPELTAERFVANPFRAGERIYRTGDRARWRHDGSLEYLGRRDDQVKVRGFRIELGEIETALLAHEGIASAVVVAREDTPGDRRLVAYVVPKGEPPTSVRLGELLRRTLPDYMVPAAFVTLDTLPLTPNGKVDRKALPPPDWKPESTATFVAPRSATEATLAQVWARTLGLERVGIDDDFFQIGGHSLLAARLLVDVDRELATRIRLAEMFDGGLTVAGMAALVDAARVQQATDVADLDAALGGVRSVTRRSHSGPAPLSAAQAQLWYFTQLAPGNPVNNGALVVRKSGPFEVNPFRAALNEIVRRHEILRSTFEVVDGDPVQVVHPAAHLELPLVDLGSLPAHQREREADSLAAADARRPYQVERGPLIRPRLIRLAEDCHRLNLAMHHLVYDATSVGILMSELVSLYDAFAAGRASPLSDPDVQYADYSVWEQEWTASADFVNRLGHWRRRLEDVPALHLQLDRPRPSEQRFRGGTQRFSVPLELVDHLRSISLGCGSTIFQAMAAAFAVLLHRYSGQEDVVFGTVADLRERPELGGMVGYCLTPLVIRADVSGNPTFIDVLRRVRGELLDAMTNQVPFERLVRELQPPREPGANPYFQAVVVMQPRVVHPAGSWEMHPLDVELGDESAEAQFDLTMYLDEHPDGHIDGCLIYDIDLFKSETVRRMVDHWSRLLESLATESQRAVSELSMLSEGELHQQLMEWNSTDTEYLRDACVHELIAEQTQRTPHAIAVVCGDERLTYAELEQRARRLARRVGESNEGGGVVAICVERSLDMLAGMLGIWKSGAAYLPLDPHYPADRLAFMLEDSGAAVLLTHRRLLPTLPEHRATVICLDDDWMSAGADADGSGTDVAPQGSVDDLAYLLYTSGSTGKPKGVQVQHRAVVNLLTSMARQPGMGPSDTVVAVTTYAFDIAVVELWLPLVTGARTVIAPREVASDGRRLAMLISDAGATVMQATPSGWQLLIDSGWKGQPGLVAWCGGEALPPQLAKALLDRTAAVWNMYGPTETTVWSTTARLEKGAPVTIGCPIANTRVYVLDQHRQPLPVGVPGELWIGGDGVTRGYLHRPEETVERFVDNPFVPGGRMYRTGDLVRWRGDGHIQYLGRLDHQVKIRGFRIELGEIETALLAHEGIASAVVVAREDTPGDRRLVAYVVPKGEPPTSAQLGELLRRTLPDYMVPAAFVTLDTLPLTPNGKVDSKALPPPEWKPVSTTGLVAPRSATEGQLATIWARILHVERVGVNDDFFEVGGHSLLAVRLLVEVDREFGVEVPLAAFFEGGGTVAGLAAAIDATREAEVVADRLTIPVQPQGTAPILFFIHADESGMLTLRHFIEPLGSDQRVVGLLPERRGRRFDRSRSIEELASPMLEAIRQSQPHGPYLLAGYSLAGLLAYELAGRLQAAGEHVAWLGLLDAGTPAASARYQQQRFSLRRRVARQRERGTRGAARKTYQVLRRELRAALVRLRLRRSEMSDEFDWRGAVALVARYACPPNDVAMDLFVSAERAAGAGSDSLGWAELHEGALRVHRFEGDHRAMVTEPQVNLVAEMFGRSLRDAVRASKAS
jgi:surfactin family lipopeptide synthetase A